MSDELNDARNARLVAKAERGSVVRDFCRHAGFALYKKELEDIVTDKKQKWLQGNDEEAKIFRYQAQGVDLALGILKRMILDGDLATSQLREAVETDSEPQQ